MSPVSPWDKQLSNYFDKKSIHSDYEEANDIANKFDGNHSIDELVCDHANQLRMMKLHEYGIRFYFKVLW